MADMKIPDWKLERYLLNELPPEQLQELKMRISGDPFLRKRLSELEKSNRRLLNEYPAEMMTQRILAGYRERTAGGVSSTERVRRPYRRVLMPVLALTTAAVVFFLVRPPDVGHHPVIPDSGIPDTTRIKGMQPGLYIYREKNGGAEEMRDGAHASYNDLLQLAYISTGDAYGVILSIDGRGVVTLHFPAEDKSARLDLNKKVLLPRAYQLDDAPGFERFFYISSRHPLDVDRIVKAAGVLAKNTEKARTGLVPVADDTHQVSITIKKSERP